MKTGPTLQIFVGVASKLPISSVRFVAKKAAPSES